MKKSNISQEDAETIMIALDQVSQTIDVMNMIVTRLKNRMAGALNGEPAAKNTDARIKDKLKKRNQLMDSLENGSLH